MAKIKNNKNEVRRVKEILRAQANTGARGQLQSKLSSAVEDSNSNALQPKKLSQRLHLEGIKKDLIKTFIFAVLVIIFLIVIKSQGLELNFGVYK